MLQEQEEMVGCPSKILHSDTIEALNVDVTILSCAREVGSPAKTTSTDMHKPAKKLKPVLTVN